MKGFSETDWPSELRQDVEAGSLQAASDFVKISKGATTPAAGSLPQAKHATDFPNIPFIPRHQPERVYFSMK